MAPTLTVELCPKWYTLFLIQPSFEITPVGFPGEEYAPHDEPVVCDHAPNPKAVRAMCEANGWELDWLAEEIIVGRWRIEHDNY